MLLDVNVVGCECAYECYWMWISHCGIWVDRKISLANSRRPWLTALTACSSQTQLANRLPGNKFDPTSSIAYSGGSGDPARLIRSMDAHFAKTFKEWDAKFLRGLNAVEAFEVDSHTENLSKKFSLSKLLAIPRMTMWLESFLLGNKFEFVQKVFLTRTKLKWLVH